MWPTGIRAPSRVVIASSLLSSAHQRCIRSEITAPLLPRDMSSLNRESESHCSSSPISRAHLSNRGWPMTCTMIHLSSLQRNASDGAAICPRLPVPIRSGCIIACSTNDALLNAKAVPRSVPSTIWPSPVLSRWINAARVPKAAPDAVP